MDRAGFAFPLKPLSPIRAVLIVSVGVVSLGGAESAVAAFARARTTMDPVKIETASQLVTPGASHLTLNPMRPGLNGALIVWALLLGNA